jgi:hypothetical protein
VKINGSRGFQADLKLVPPAREVLVLERARLVWINIAAQFTECTWSIEALFSGIKYHDPFTLRSSIVSTALVSDFQSIHPI